MTNKDGAIFDDLLTANRSYASGFDLAGLSPSAARGLAVLTCIDSRIEPLAMLGLVPGDAKILRNAGARVTDDSERSLILAAHLLGVTRIAVVAHTNCRMAGASDAEIRQEIASLSGANTDEWEPLGIDNQEVTLAADIARLRACPLLPSEIAIGGFIYDVDTGTLSLVTI